MADERYNDPVVEAYKKDVDISLLRENLKLTHEERLIKHQKMLEFVLELRKAGEKARAEKRGI